MIRKNYWFYHLKTGKKCYTIELLERVVNGDGEKWQLGYKRTICLYIINKKKLSIFSVPIDRRKGGIHYE